VCRYRFIELLRRFYEVAHGANKDGHCLRVEKHHPALGGHVMHPGLFVGDFYAKEFYHLPNERLAVLGCIVSEPFVEVEVLASRRQRSDVEGESEWLNLKEGIKDFEVLCNIEDAGDIDWVLVVVVAEGSE